MILYIFLTVFGCFGYLFVFCFILGTILLFVCFPVYLQVFLVTNLSGDDGTANPPTLPGT